METSPTPIRACGLAWIAVRTCDQADVVTRLALVVEREISWAGGIELIDKVVGDGSRGYPTVVVTPTVDGWTLIVGPWAGLPYLKHTAYVTDLCRELSAHFGQAQAFFHSEQNDGEAWLIARDGEVLRRWIAEYPELALGEPFGAERRLLDDFGIVGRPEDLDPDDDLASGWAATWGGCWATTVAADSSVDPTGIGPGSQIVGRMLVATPPAFEPLDPMTGTAPYGDNAWSANR